MVVGGGCTMCACFCSRDDSLFLRLCDSAEFSGYKQTSPGCTLLGRKAEDEDVTKVKTRGRGRRDKDVEGIEEEKE